MKVLITGGSFVNKGAEAMVRVAHSTIRHALPGAEVLATGRLSTSADELGGLVPFALPSPGHQLLERLPLSRRRVLRELGAVLDVSGYRYGDPWTRPPRSVVRALARALNLGDPLVLSALRLPLIFMPQAWGPFERQYSAQLTDRLLRNALVAFARDDESYTHLQSLPSFDPERVHVASDIAFTFECPPAAVGLHLLQRYRVDQREGPIVGLVPNMRLYERLQPVGPANPYIVACVDAASHFARLHGATVLLMPHEIKVTGDGSPDDRHLCDMIARVAAMPHRIVPLLCEHSAEELKALISQMDMVISSRFHAIVAALTLSKPVVSVAWSHKYRQLLGSVGLGEYVIDVSDFGPRELTDRAQQAWARRDALVVALGPAVERHRRSAQTALQMVHRHLSALAT